MMRFIGIFIIFPLFIFSQENRVLIRGAVQFDYENGDYSNIVITNKNTQESTITNVMGQFQIKAKVGDEIIASALHIYTKNSTILLSNIEKKALLILIEPLYIPLSDVNAYPFQVTGNLEYDSRRIKVVDTMDMLVKNMNLQKPGKPRDEWKHINKPILPSITSLDLDALYDVISGKRKKSVAFYLYNEKVEMINAIEDYFKTDFFTLNLALPQEEIFSFIYTVSELVDIKTLYKKDDYNSILEYLVYYAPEYKQRLKERDIFSTQKP